MSALKAMCQTRGVDVQTIVDVGAGYGIFLEEWKRDDPNVEAIAIEPSLDLAETCKTKGLTVKPVTLENVNASDIQADVAVCFEVLEHVHDPFIFLQKMSDLVRPGGLVMISTLSIDGFDLQVLGHKSDQISPPHHINFLSCDGMKALFSRAGLQEVLVTTPGKLDVDIVRGAVKKSNSCVDLPPIIQAILSDPQASSDFQDFLSRNRLSSHAWIVGSKRI
ncbi:class I SAM-dependent methyltransferase [Arenicellales bacterium IMCC55707]